MSSDIVTIALWIALLLTSSSNAVGHVDRARPRSLDADGLPPIPVAVLAPPEIKASLVNKICAEAAAIWAPAGITFDCHRIAAPDEADRTEIEVTVDDGRREGPQEWLGAVGWITFTNGSPDKSIHLSRAKARDLLVDAGDLGNRTISSDEALVGRALGRALSHELGHYLLKSKIHTPHGLMRAIWTPYDFFAITRDGLRLTPEERQVVLQHIRDDGLTVCTDWKPQAGRTQ